MSKQVEIVYGVEPTNYPEYPFMVVPRRANGLVAIEPHEYGFFLCRTVEEATAKLNAIARQLDGAGRTLAVA